MINSLLDPEGIYFSAYFSRKDCRLIRRKGIKYIDDLGRVPSRVVAIDNSLVAFGYDLDNLIPIKTWLSGSDDFELLRCLDILDAFYSSGFDDVRNFLKLLFGLNSLVNSLNVS
jgi:TFIIF-interacting CTD phosphatase-like protein